MRSILDIQSESIQGSIYNVMYWKFIARTKSPWKWIRGAESRVHSRNPGRGPGQESANQDLIGGFRSFVADDGKALGDMHHTHKTDLLKKNGALI